MIIFLYGEDAFSSSQKVLEIKEKFLKSDPAGSGLSIFDFEEKGKKQSPEDVLSMPNLLAPKRLVVIKNLLAAGTDAEQERMKEYLEKNAAIGDDSDVVAVFSENTQPKKSNALFKFLESGKLEVKKHNFEKLSGLKLNQWAAKRIKELDGEASISKPALDTLVAYVSNDSYLLDNEIQKLVAFVDGQMIGEKEVELLVKANVDSNIFKTVDALGNNDKREALKLLHRHLASGDDPFYILSMFIYQFRNLLKVADLKDNQGAQEGEIVRITKLHPFVVKKSLSQIRSFSLAGQSWSRLKKIYQKLSDLDTAVKTGKIDIKAGLDKFIVEL